MAELTDEQYDILQEDIQKASDHLEYLLKISRAYNAKLDSEKVKRYKKKTNQELIKLK